MCSLVGLCSTPHRTMCAWRCRGWLPGFPSSAWRGGVRSLGGINNTDRAEMRPGSGSVFINVGIPGKLSVPKYLNPVLSGIFCVLGDE